MIRAAVVALLERLNWTLSPYAARNLRCSLPVQFVPGGLELKSRRIVRVRQVVACCGALVALAAGCDTGIDPVLLFFPQTREAIDLTHSSRSTTSFAAAPLLTFDASRQILARGRITSPDNYQVVNIGPVESGRQIEVQVESLDRGFDPAVGIFDEAESCLFINDDRVYRRQLDAYAKITIPQYSSDCYVVIAASPASETVGDFMLTVRDVSIQSPPQPEPQVIYLDFNGGEKVRIASNAPIDVPPFSGAMIDADLESQTDLLIELLVERVRYDFEPYDVVVLSSHESPPPVEKYSSVYMGSYNSHLLGIADNVDSFNAEPVQDAIVFVDTFEVFLGLDPSIEDLVDALANVTSHEIGHLLGLQHTRDSAGIMDTSATLRQMMVAQSFRTSALHPETFVIGRQDAPRTLLSNVGGDPLLAEQRAMAKIFNPPALPDELPGRVMLKFGTGCDHALPQGIDR